MKFDYKNILIMGYGESGKAVEKILKSLNINYRIYDKSHGVNGGGYLCRLSKKIISTFDLVVISPGISIYNKYIIMAERMGIKVVGELEFGYWFTSSPVIGITGTNGKTTTTMMINEIVNTTYTSGTYGNIGIPLCCAYQKQVDYLVCEVSSFQLESTYSFNPYISVILNIAEDHIDRHKTFENYIKCKLGLIKNCNEKSLIVLNADDKLLMERTVNIKARKFYFSKYKKVKGVYLIDEDIYINIKNKPYKFASFKDFEHLSTVIDDVLASILVGALMQIDEDKIRIAIKNFSLAPHRMKLILEKNNVKYIDDSKSTNVHSTLNALSVSSNGIVLLLGGEDKDLNFDEIFVKYSGKLSYVVAFGKARKKIEKCAIKCGFVNIKSFKTFVEAVKAGYAQAKGNGVLLLSPACASFDEFNSYVERGEKFEKIIKDLSNAKS